MTIYTSNSHVEGFLEKTRGYLSSVLISEGIRRTLASELVTTSVRDTGRIESEFAKLQLSFSQGSDLILRVEENSPKIA